MRNHFVVHLISHWEKYVLKSITEGKFIKKIRVRDKRFGILIHDCLKFHANLYGRPVFDYFFKKQFKHGNYKPSTNKWLQNWWLYCYLAQSRESTIFILWICDWHTNPKKPRLYLSIAYHHFLKSLLQKIFVLNEWGW